MKRVEFKGLNEKLQKLIIEKGANNPNFDADKFLSPSLDDMNDPFLLSGMTEAVERVKLALINKERILIYGDYDCDGISASTILYLYLKSKNADVYAFIPNRFDDGYGLSAATIEDIANNIKPNLIITVDLGITAIKETEEIKSKGIDIIITDHHEIGDSLPNTTVIDPKIPNQEYPFSGLCGCGVALKLIEALGGRNEAYKYFDFAAIATIGDIVPLTDENRVIAKLGLEKINNGEAHESIKYMIKNLDLSNITSTDVAFKIVPRINASGRMNTSKKVFDFFVETEENKLFELYSILESDNIERLDEIQKGNQEIEKSLKEIDINASKVLILSGDFHQGVLGILSSRISHDYNRPTICFSKTDYGTYKGSGRSVGSIDLHDMVLKLSHLCMRSGGHKMAIGLEVEESKFEEFKTELNKLAMDTIDDNELIDKLEYSLEIEESDINKKFIEELSYLEPFGCENEKPIFMLRCNSLNAEQMSGKSFKHYKFITPKGKQIVAFSSYKNVDLLTNSGEKMLILDLENNNYKGKTYPQAILKNARMCTYNFNETRQKNMISSLIGLYKSTIIDNHHDKQCFEYDKRNLIKTLKNNIKSKFSTLVVIDNSFDNQTVKDIEALGFVISHIPLPNKQNVVLVREEGLTELNEIVNYTNVYFTRRAFKDEHKHLSKVTNVYEPDFITKLSAKINTSREVLGACFVAIKNNLNLLAINIFDWASKLNKIVKNISESELVFALLVFSELKILTINFEPNNFNVEKGENFTSKRSLTDSTIYNTVLKSIEKNM